MRSQVRMRRERGELEFKSSKQERRDILRSLLHWSEKRQDVCIELNKSNLFI